MISDTPGNHSKAALEDMKAPGSWLSHIAMKATLTTDVGSTSDVGSLFLDTLVGASALMASGPTLVDITTSSIRLPKLAAELTPADVVAELDPMPERGPGLTSVEVTPPRIAVLDVVSEEPGATLALPFSKLSSASWCAPLPPDSTTSRGTPRGPIPAGPAS